MILTNLIKKSTDGWMNSPDRWFDKVIQQFKVAYYDLPHLMRLEKYPGREIKRIEEYKR